MRTDISLNRFGWLYRLDYKKLIIAALLLRLIAASVYDVFVNITDKEILLPDSKAYSARGRYVDLTLQGYDKASFAKGLLPSDRISKEIFIETLRQENGGLPSRVNESNIYYYVIGFLYFIFGYFTIWVRMFNIVISIVSVYLLFRVSKHCFGDLAANLFLLIALFLPTQFVYSITLSRDFMRVLIVSVIVWAVYTMGGIWTKKLKPQF